MLLAHLYEADAEFARQLDQDLDAGQHVEGGEDLDCFTGQREVRIAMLEVVSVLTPK